MEWAMPRLLFMIQIYCINNIFTYFLFKNVVKIWFKQYFSPSGRPFTGIAYHCIMQEIACGLDRCFLCQHCIPEWKEVIALRKKTFLIRRGKPLFQEGEKV